MLSPPRCTSVLSTVCCVLTLYRFAQRYQRSIDEPASPVAHADRRCHRHHRMAVAPPDTKRSVAFRETFANDQPLLLVVPSVPWRSVSPSRTTTMPKRGRRGCGSISRHKRGDKLKKSSTTHLHPTSVLYVPGQDETTAEQPRGNGQGQDKKIKVSNLVRTNKRLKEVNSELVSEKSTPRKGLQRPKQ